MEISPIGDGGYYIEIKEEDLGAENFDDIIARGAEIFPHNTMLEIFPGADGVLIFARTYSGSAIMFTFSDFEHAVLAASLCECDGCTSFLIGDLEEYHILYVPLEKELPPAPLYEFSTRSSRVDQNYLIHLREQEDIILGPFAIKELKSMGK